MDAAAKDKLLEAIQNDLKNISVESKRSRSLQAVRESTEEAISGLRAVGAAGAPSDVHELFMASNRVLYPLLQGCETKDPRLVRMCLSSTQRLIVNKALDFRGALYVADALWMLMESGIEEVKIVQTVTLLVTSSHAAQNDTLAKCLVVCFRLSFAKDPTVATIAGASVRQLVPAVVERAAASSTPCDLCLQHAYEEPGRKIAGLVRGVFPADANPFLLDAYLLVQDLVLLVGADQPVWMAGIVEMTRTFGLELLESLLSGFPGVFLEHTQFAALLKERVCSLVIKLLSPNLKFQQKEPPAYPITAKLLRVMSVLVIRYHDVLTTESEIFLSLATKFLDPDKPSWQNGCGLEVVHKVVTRPELLRFVCANIDDAAEDSHVVRDLVNSIAAFVQNVMVESIDDNNQEDDHVHHNHHQPGFRLRNVFKPLTLTFVGGQTKDVFLDVGAAPPNVSDGYSLSLAYVCLLDVVRSTSLLAVGERENLLESTWCGLLSALSLLLDASADDSTTDAILKALETFASFCGGQKVVVARDAFLAAICKASLPPRYTLEILKATASTQNVSRHDDVHHEVVAVGTPLPTSSSSSSSSSAAVMLTAKNLQCMRSILSVAHCHGDVLGSSWHIVLTTLQHLVWILGFRPSSAGALTPPAPSDASMITTAVMADLPVLSSMVDGLFEGSKEMSEPSLKHLVAALCRLSEESMALASGGRETSLFAVAKLLRTALANLSRPPEVAFRPVTTHLLAVCQHPNLRVRERGCEALTHLVRRAAATCALADQSLALSPLAELSSAPHPDVRQKQLDAVTSVLGGGGGVREGWPLLLTMIGALRDDHSDILVRSAFRCLQLVFTDFLPAVPYRCYPLCVETAAKFGGQKAELNVSLTAIGLLWNLSDYFYQNAAAAAAANNASGKKKEGEAGEQLSIFPECFLLAFPGSKSMTSFDKLWMCLYCKLKDLCLDDRPSVRKSSGQTLFSTIAAHGSVLEASTWRAVLWQVLFPLLDNVIIQSDNASSEKVSQSRQIMIHHTRNTARKQWAETKVLTISGVVRVFNTKRNLLRSIGDYSKAWVLLLEYVEKMALSDTAEVSLAALKALQELIAASSSTASSSLRQRPEKEEKVRAELQDINWTLCWKAWTNIGAQKSNYMANTSEPVHRGQVLLTGFVQIFPELFPHVRPTFRREDVETLGKVLLSCARVSPGDAAAAESGGGFAPAVTPLHAAVVECVELVKEFALKENETVLPAMFEVLFSLAAASLTVDESASSSAASSKDRRFREKFSLFGEACLETVAVTYEASAESERILAENVLFKIVRVLNIPLRQRHRCYLRSNWRTAVNVLVRVLRRGVPVARRRRERDDFSDLWCELGDLLEKFMFPQSTEDQKAEDRVADEAVDCHLVELLREEVLPHPVEVPTPFVKKMVVLLNRGSIHSTMTLSDDCSGSVGLREDFAKQCFETLLEFSLLDHPQASTGASGASPKPGGEATTTNRLAIASLLQRFKEVLVDAIDGEKLSRNIPLQRQKTAEISFVLKAIGTVVSSMKKKRPTSSVSKKTWAQIVALYPYLVQFTGTSSPQISASVKDALLEYHDLLKA